MGESQGEAGHTMPAPARTAIERWQSRFAGSGTQPALVTWAPGRINLIGEHTDYNDGLVLPLAVTYRVAVAGRSVPGQRARVYSTRDDAVVELDLSRASLLAPGPEPTLPRWARYVWGALGALAARAGMAELPAFEAAIAGDVPVGGGMSSSSALTVAALAFAAALAGSEFSSVELAHLAQLGEQRGSGVLGGIMDQMTACLGREGSALLLDCRSMTYEYIPLRLPNTLLVAYDTRVPHELAVSEYNTRRRECEQAVERLAPVLAAETPGRKIAALRDVTPGDMARHDDLLPDTLLWRARHVIAENFRVERAADALREGEVAVLGGLLYASHESLRDNYEVSSPELDAVVEIAASVPGVIGARMMGAGFGGSALILVERTAWPALAEALARDYPRRTGRTGQAHVCASADGVAVTTWDSRESG